MSPRAVDPAVIAFRRVPPKQWDDLSGKAAIDTALAIFKENPPARAELIGMDAAQYLEQFIAATQEHIRRAHSGYGSVRWLWYLRRAPEAIFSGSYDTTVGYDRFLAEIMSSGFAREDRSELATRITFRVDDAAIRHVASFVGRVKLLSQLHILYRRIGKGATLDARLPILAAKTPAGVESAIAIYDQRHDRSHEFFGSGLGLATVEPNSTNFVEAAERFDLTAFLSFGCTPSYYPTIRYPDANGAQIEVTVEARHMLKTLDLRNALRPFDGEAGSPEYLREVAPLIQLLVMLPALMTQVPWAFGTILQQGYFFCGATRLEALFDAYLPEATAILAGETPGLRWPITAAEWLGAVNQINVCPWPLMAGNICRRYAEQYLLDITGCSQAFLQRLEISRAPALGNVRGAAFELQCQEIIDRSAWAPPPAIRELRGRALRRAGQRLTDIDALATMDGVLLIVSSKSRIYDREYDRGTYRVVENERSRIDEAVTQWDSVVEGLNRDPAGDNFDFSAFKQIVGVVCTPFPVYTSNDRSLRFVKDGLRASCSAHELRDWLE
ncbi:hypothetical protein FVF58_50265 [Paraburkholderia panacisoli]|uniref:Uncharacterized protein n=1 Tax=Paraburkholderia panacisoli TaxID=2603818 RepID=A0A5B0G0Q0_9BURK|nr:hypothetical protein [Paraburkholderia panacisoli]KAA0996168.1 hypothetical protein FVF58_50265 [Paraburkholderia panacisoli]